MLPGAPGENAIERNPLVVRIHVGSESGIGLDPGHEILAPFDGAGEPDFIAIEVLEIDGVGAGDGVAIPGLL